MAKKVTTNEAPAEAVEQINLPAIPTGEDYINKAVNDLQAVDGQQLIDTQIESLKGQYLGLIVSDLNDRPAYIALKDGAKLAKNLRLSVENKRKELNEFPLKFQRAVNAEAKRITELLTPVEQHCLAEVAKFEKAEEEEKRKEQAARHSALVNQGWIYNGSFYVCGPISMTVDQVMRLTEEGMSKALKHGQEEEERQAAEKARMEAEQKRQAEEAERLRKEQEQLRAEQEAMRKEREELERMKAELAAEKARKEAAAKVVVAPPSSEAVELAQDAMNKLAETMEVDTDVDPFGHVVIEAASNDVFAPAHSSEYIDGYEHCRSAVLAIFNDNIPRKRAEFIEAINNLKP